MRACANKRTGALGLARRCRRGERALSWNKEGRPGPTGATGAIGAQGPQGPGAASFAGMLVGTGRATLAKLSNHTEVIGECTGSEVALTIQSGYSLHFLLFGTVSKDGTLGPVKEGGEPPFGLKAAAKAEVMFDGVDSENNQVGLASFAHIDARGSLRSGVCEFSGMTIPS